MSDTPAAGREDLVAPAIAGVLTTNEFVARDALFQRKDQAAVAEQVRTFRLLRWINWLVLAVAVLSGIALARAGLEGVLAETPLAPWAGQAGAAIAAVLAGLTVLTTALGQFARDGDRLGRWQRLRADAEVARTERFRFVAQQAAAAGPAAAKEALDYVRRELLDDQRTYYIKRSDRHRSSSIVSVAWAQVAALLGATASVAATAVALGAATEWLLVIGTFAAAAAAFAMDRENLYRDRTNAELYATTADRLAALSAGVDRVANEIDQGHPHAVAAFTDLIIQELRAEHQQWTASLDVTRDMLAHLDQRLQQAKTTRTGTASGGGPLGGLVGQIDADAGILGNMALPLDLGSMQAWQRILTAAGHALPSPYAERAGEMLAALSRLAGAASTSGGTSAFIEGLAQDNPVLEWISRDLQKLAPVLGSFSPLGLVIGLGQVGGSLGEEAYHRWVARVLGLPVVGRMLTINTLDSTTALAAFDASPILAAAYAAERTMGDLAAIGRVVDLARTAPDTLWAADATRFPAGRAQFDAGVQQVREALLHILGDADLSSLLAAAPTAVNPGALLTAATAARSMGGSSDILHAAVQFIHELLGEGDPDPAQTLLLLSQGGGKP